MGPQRVFARVVSRRSSTIASDATLRPRVRRLQQMNLRPALMRLGPDLAVMVRSDLAKDRQPHAGTSELRLAVQKLEWRKYIVNLLGRNTDPVVFDCDMQVDAFCTEIGCAWFRAIVFKYLNISVFVY